MSDDHILYNLDGNIARIRLNNPTALNALSPSMLQQLRAALGRAEKEARVIVLSGTGRSFCAGADLGGDSLNPGGDVDPAKVLLEEYNPLVRQISDLKVPLITQIQGIAAGAGAALALLGDIVIAAESANFILAYRSVGVVPDAGATFLLTRAVGRIRALELMLLGKKLPAPKAYEWGLVTRIAPDAELDAVVDSLAGELGCAATQALARIRRMNWQALEGSLDDQLDRECVLQREIASTVDFQEGVSAFREKRSAQFIGR